MRQRGRGIEMYIVRIVHAILMTLQITKATICQAWIIKSQRLAQRVVAFQPDCAAIRNEIQLIEYGAFIPIGQAAIKLNKSLARDLLYLS